MSAIFITGTQQKMNEAKIRATSVEVNNFLFRKTEPFKPKG